MKEVLIVDDHPAIMEGTRSMLEMSEEMQVTISSSAAQTLELIRTKRFDVLLLDLYMPQMNGVDLAKEILKAVSDATILIYTGHDITPYFNIFMEAGISGFISKTATQEQLLTSIRCALRKEVVVPLNLLKELHRENLPAPAGPDQQDAASHGAVTAKDMEILKYLAKGKSNRQISELMLVSQRSLEYSLTQIFQKLQVKSRIEAVVKARAHKLILTEDFV